MTRFIYEKIIKKTLTILLIIYAGSAAAEGKVNDLCHIGNRVDKLEITNYPHDYELLVAVDDKRLNEIYKYKVEIAYLDNKESKKLLSSYRWIILNKKKMSLM